MSKPVVMQISDLPKPAEDSLHACCTLLRLPDRGPDRAALLNRHAPQVRALAGTGKGKVDSALLDALPNLELISVTSAGLDGIDTEAAASRAIPIFSTSHILAGDVADLALWLILGTTRRLLEADRFVRRGAWTRATPFPTGRTIAGMRVGILGLGHIGKETARRLELLGAGIGYCGRHRQEACAYRYFPSVRALAEWCELLVISCPSNAQTYRLVDAAVLTALGPDGILVNVARGAIVDEPALVDAVENGRLAAVGLDVFEDEPSVPTALIASDHSILLPHIGSATEQTRTRMWQGMVDAIIHQLGLPGIRWTARSLSGPR